MTNKIEEHQIDAIDQKILSFLVKNARMSYLEISRECGISGAAIHQRVKKMENLGIITGSRLLVKPQALGLKVCAFVGVSLSSANEYHHVVDELKKIPEVVECNFITGNHALMLKIYCFDNEHLMKVLIGTIQDIDGIEKTETWIVLDEAFERQVWVKEYDYNDKEKPKAAKSKAAKPKAKTTKKASAK